MIARDTKERVTAICAKKFPLRYDPDRKQENARALMGLLLEEGGELAGAIRSFFGRKYRPELETGNLNSIKGEVGDILVVLNGVCDTFGISMDEALNMAAAKLEKRFEEEQQRSANV